MREDAPTGYTLCGNAQRFAHENVSINRRGSCAKTRAQVLNIIIKGRYDNKRI